jgi:O-antigen/teichoic acid export membrane protein
MASQKHFLHDRTALLLVSGAAFLTLVAVLLIVLKLGSGQGTTNYIVSYRDNLGIDRYTTGTSLDILSFAVAAVLVFGVGITLAYRSYAVKRELSLTVLALTVPLLLFLIIVSNALLVLR